MTNVIYKDEDMYGFVEDLIVEFEKQLEWCKEEEDECGYELVVEALETLKKEEDDNKFFRVWYNPMGAYVFNEMKEVE